MGIISKLSANGGKPEPNSRRRDPMSPIEVETTLKFYMSKLSEQELAELDEALANGVPPDAMASDAAIKRRQWLDIGSHARIAARDARQKRLKPAADSAEFARMFPHANRLG